MKDKRSKQRRNFTPASQFPVHTQSGNVIVSDRRRLPTRRVNDIKVEELSYRDFITLLKLQKRQDQLVYFDLETPLILRD